jgi:hypothetical protein
MKHSMQTRSFSPPPSYPDVSGCQNHLVPSPVFRLVHGQIGPQLELVGLFVGYQLRHADAHGNRPELTTQIGHPLGPFSGDHTYERDRHKTIGQDRCRDLTLRKRTPYCLGKELL